MEGTILLTEALLFAEWTDAYGYDYCIKTKLWSYWDKGLTDIQEYTTEELFNIFKKQVNGTTH